MIITLGVFFRFLAAFVLAWAATCVEQNPEVNEYVFNGTAATRVIFADGTPAGTRSPLVPVCDITEVFFNELSGGVALIRSQDYDSVSGIDVNGELLSVLRRDLAGGNASLFIRSSTEFVRIVVKKPPSGGRLQLTFYCRNDLLNPQPATQARFIL